MFASGRVAKQAEPRLDAIKQALQQAGMNRLVLATDPDREGEAIAQHLSQVLEVTSHFAHTEKLSLHHTILRVCLLVRSAVPEVGCSLVLCGAEAAQHQLDHQLHYRTTKQRSFLQLHLALWVSTCLTIICVHKHKYRRCLTFATMKTRAHK